MEIFVQLISVRSGRINYVNLKIPLTSMGIEHATFQLVTHYQLPQSVSPSINCLQNAELINVPVCGIYIYHSTLDGNFNSNFKLVRARGEVVG
jgi:hypothetical protein